MAKARIKIPSYLLDMPRSKWEHLIDEYIKDENDRYIAIRYYLDDAWVRVDDEILTGDEIIEVIQSYINEYIEISLLGYEAL